jgi:hypothetical protein
MAVRSPSVRARVRPAEGRRSSRAGALLRRVPTAAWACALIALLNAATWSLIIPPFEGKDESDHFAYVEQIVENGSLPENGQQNGNYSTQENLVLRALHSGEVLHSPQNTSITTQAEQRALIEANGAGASLRGSGEAGIATSEPPLYYMVQAIPYLLARGNILAQLQLMRLVGALFAAITALFTFLFLREVLPRPPWAATVGALAVALQPLLAFMSGSVNPDSMLFAVAAVVFASPARFAGDSHRASPSSSGSALPSAFSRSSTSSASRSVCTWGLSCSRSAKRGRAVAQRCARRCSPL